MEKKLNRVPQFKKVKSKDETMIELCRTLRKSVCVCVCIIFFDVAHLQTLSKQNWEVEIFIIPFIVCRFSRSVKVMDC